MEISNVCLLQHQITLFKIDLIVWKYNVPDVHVFTIITFKIDLIVWK